MKHIVVLGFLTLFYQKTYAQRGDCSHPGGECICQLGWWGRNCEYPLECLITGDNGVHYRGTQNVTSDGRVCDPWDLTNPKGGSFETPPDDPQHNYCRHALSDATSNPWCYTTKTVPYRRWATCNISLCDTQCAPPKIKQHAQLLARPRFGFEVNSRITFGCEAGYTLACEPLECLIPGDNGVHYRGTQNVTSYGTTCDPWDLTNPPGGGFLKPPDGPHHNYCRHVQFDSQPNTWCFTTKAPPHKRWTACNIPLCDSVKLSSKNPCQKGYYKPDSITCTSTKRWSDEAPGCTVTCAKPTTDHSTIISTFKRQYERGDIIKLQCNKGYVPIIPTTLLCQANGNWNGSMSICKDINECSIAELCPSPSTVCVNTDGSFICNCSNGYIRIHKDQNRCVKTCETPHTDNYSHIASINKEMYVEGDTIKIQCNKGYITPNSTTFSCTESGKWNGSMPICVAVCVAPTLYNHSVIVQPKQSYIFMDTIEVQCDAGYNTTDETYFSCLNSKSWNGSMPTCSVIKCNLPTTMKYSKIINATKAVAHGARIAIECNNGYMMNGTGILTCEVNQLWDHPTPTCQKTCETPGTDNYSHIASITKEQYVEGDIIKIQCNKGYITTNSTTFSCTRNGKWNGSMPTCVAVCIRPILHNHSGIVQPQRSPIYIFKDRIEVKCDVGYNTTDETQFFCQNNGRWNDHMPICSVIKCNLPTILEQSKIINASKAVSFGERITIECNNGYMKNGTGILTCKENQLWDHPSPTCQAICKPPSLECNSRLLKNRTRYILHDAIEIECDDGFEVEGETRFICQNDKSWNGTMPKCRPKKVHYDTAETLATVFIGTTLGLAICLIGVTVALILTCSRYRSIEKNRTISASTKEIGLENIHLHESLNQYDVINHEHKEPQSIYDELTSS